jgi:aminoglycoside phosphotransferase (APT) family kinase protein
VSLFDESDLRSKISGYLSTRTGEPVQVESLVRYAVGFSWLTYGVRVSGLTTAKELILRLGPDYGLFAPYSAKPQALAMLALAGSEVPVPKAYWYDDDRTVFGAPFLFCEKVEGTAVVPWASAALPPLLDQQRLSLADDFIDALAALHRFNWADSVIAERATGITLANTANTQLEFWNQQYQRWAMRAYPLFEWGLHWLMLHCPVAPRLSIVHGDYRTGNFLEISGRITSILDWELTYIGDPHDDLAWASLPMYMGGTKYVSRLIEPEKFFAKYQAQVPFSVSQASLKFYRVFSLLKLAATHMAAARCFEEGRFNDLRMPAMGSQILPVLRQMEKAIDSPL